MFNTFKDIKGTLKLKLRRGHPTAQDKFESEQTELIEVIIQLKLAYQNRLLELSYVDRIRNGTTTLEIVWHSLEK